MAFLPEDDKLQGTEDQKSGPGSSSSPLVGSGGSDVGTGVSTAGVGAGGTGGWTNIQAYLKANEGNNTTANALGNTVGSEFDKEESKLQSDSDAAKNQATEAAKTNYSNDQVDDYVNRASHGESEAAKTMKNYLSGQYSGPQQFAYGMGAKTQEYGANLGDDNSFNALLGGIYNKAAGGQMSSGQLALQQQLDVNNPTLAKARSDLGARYSALQKNAGLKVEETNNALRDAKNAYEKGQNDTKAYLGNRSGALANQIHLLEAQHPDPYGPEEADPRIAPARQFNAIQDFLGLGGQMEIGQGQRPVIKPVEQPPDEVLRNVAPR